LLYLVRWFWWRVNAWCEVAAMISSFGISVLFVVLSKYGIHMSTHVALLITVAGTTACWVLTAFVGPPTDRQVLIEFYRKVRPAGAGWARVRAEAGVTEGDARAAGDNLPMALLGWLAGCTAIWSSLFTVGNVLYGRPGVAAMLFGVFVVSGLALLFVTRSLWSQGDRSGTDRPT
jgi:hypothetical protein